MSNGSCSLFIEGKGKISVSIDKHSSLFDIGFTGLHGCGATGRDVVRVCEEKAAIRCALRSAGFHVPIANIQIEVDQSTYEFGHKCIENACAQGIAIASGQAEMPAGGRVSAVEIEIDGSSLGLEPAKEGLKRDFDDLCDEKQAEADLIAVAADNSEKPERKETGR